MYPPPLIENESASCKAKSLFIVNSYVCCSLNCKPSELILSRRYVYIKHMLRRKVFEEVKKMILIIKMSRHLTWENASWLALEGGPFIKSNQKIIVSCRDGAFNLRGNEEIKRGSCDNVFTVLNLLGLRKWYSRIWRFDTKAAASRALPLSSHPPSSVSQSLSLSKHRMKFPYLPRNWTPKEEHNCLWCPPWNFINKRRLKLIEEETEN